MRPTRAATGFTLVESIVVVVMVAAIIGIVLVAINRPVRHTHGSMRDSSQVRGVLQGLVLWSQSNQDRFPLPSLLDPADATVTDQGDAKNTSANICSVLIFNSFFPPELLVSPQEANGNIERMEGYTLDLPPTAVNPAKALWDPALRADFTGKQPGNVSYAHLLPCGPELDAEGRIGYGANDNATQAVIGNRGPQIAGITLDKSGKPIPTYAPVPGTGDSLTFLIHGSRDKWEGNIGYADNHVNFETRMDPESAPYIAAGMARPDCLFFEEPDAGGLDNFLGIYIKAGAERKDFQTIWD